eukprot:11379461-Alexandrium_andersonii.AAC.1
MSASLVGSEMCIRDSPRHHTTITLSAAHTRPAQGDVLTLTPLGTARPVSYTHLTLPTICSV